MSVPRIPEDELSFGYSRSSGPGGQNVNRVETRVTLMFDVDASPSLTEAQKQRLRTRLATRINKEGILRVVSQRYRTRDANRRGAIERFESLLRDALKTRKRRRKTKVSKSEKRRRLDAKRRRAEVKRSRSKPRRWDD